MLGPPPPFLGPRATSQSGDRLRGAGHISAPSLPAPRAAGRGRYATGPGRGSGDGAWPAGGAARLGLSLGLRGGGSSGGGGGGLGPGAAAAAAAAAGPGAGSKMAAAAAAAGPGAGGAGVAVPSGTGPCAAVSVFPGARLLTIGDANGEIQRHAEQQALRLEVRAGPDAAGIALYSRECGAPGPDSARGCPRGRPGGGPWREGRARGEGLGGRREGALSCGARGAEPGELGVGARRRGALERCHGAARKEGVRGGQRRGAPSVEGSGKRGQ